MKIGRILGVILMLSVAGCQSAGKNTAVGAGVGAAAGGALGAVLGHQTGKRGEAAAIGAVLGATTGGLIGNRMDKQAAELAQIAETKRTDQGLITKLKSDILFDTGKADLKPVAIKNMTKMASIMKKYPENVLTVKGFTDNTGSDQFNLALSERRAAAVRAELVRGGVPDSTIKIVGMGESNPVADNSSPELRAQNRRVEIEVKVDPSKVPQRQ